MARSRGPRLAIREARLITKELRMLGVPARSIAKLWACVVGAPLVLVMGYFAINYDSGTADLLVLSRIQITPKDRYHVHVHNNSSLTLKSLSLTCYPGGDSQPVTATTRLYPPLIPGYGEDAYISGDCRLVRVNESHQLW